MTISASYTTPRDTILTPPVFVPKLSGRGQLEGQDELPIWIGVKCRANTGYAQATKRIDGIFPQNSIADPSTPPSGRQIEC